MFSQIARNLPRSETVVAPMAIRKVLSIFRAAAFSHNQDPQQTPGVIGFWCDVFVTTSGNWGQTGHFASSHVVSFGLDCARAGRGLT